MNPDKLAANKVKASTQQYLDIAEIKKNTAVMRDGSLRAVLLASSINFALKSEDEQNALVYGYISFLNNLDFPLQIVIQSRELDMGGYLARLRQKEKEQTNDLLKLQMEEHIRYIEELVSLGEIMTKKFFVVIGYNPSGEVKRGFAHAFLSVFRPAAVIKLKEDIFEERREILSKRVHQVAGDLNGLGIETAEIDTQGLIELYYSTYNPGTAEREKIQTNYELNRL